MKISADPIRTAPPRSIERTIEIPDTFIVGVGEPTLGLTSARMRSTVGVGMFQLLVPGLPH